MLKINNLHCFGCERKMDKQKKRIKKINKNQPFFKSFLLTLAYWIKNRPYMRKVVIPWFIREEVGQVPHLEKINKQRDALERISQSDKPILVGPWLSEIGFEVLYWIPFLNWFVKTYKINKDRITIVSRGGVHLWYRSISKNYIDIFDYYTAQEFKENNARRIEVNSQKHIAISDFDEEIFNKVRNSVFKEKFDVLHPSRMYNLFKLAWKDHYPLKLIDNFTEYTRYKDMPFSLDIDLPEKYVAVKFYFSECFPATEENKAFIRSMLSNLSQQIDVVLLSTGLDIDDHKDFDFSSADRIHVLNDHITLANNLEFQTNIIRNSVGFIGTYGGFSYIPPFYGVPSVALYSRGDKFLPVHLDVAYHAFRVLQYGEFGKVKNKNFDPSMIKKQPEFIPLDIKNIPILNLMLSREEQNDSFLRQFVAV